MSDDLERVARLLADAADYTAIFHDEAELKRAYLKLAQLVHPDRHANNPIAAEALTRLNILKDQADRAAAEGRFGQPIELASIRTKAAVHSVKYRMGDGDVCQLYRTATTREENGDTLLRGGVLKVAKSPKDHDLLATEAAALKALHDTDEVLKRHYPMLLDRFAYSPDKGPRRRANVVEYQPGLTLAQLRMEFRSGISAVHTTWVWRRLLMALGHAHDTGIIHGAVLPEHVLVHPKTHAVLLLDWCYASICSDGKQPPIKALAGGPARRGWHPAEVLDRGEPSAATDLLMAARTIVWCLGGDPLTGKLMDQAPKQMRAFFRGCLQDQQSMRPQNAWELLSEFDQMLPRIGKPYFPRQYVELFVPSGTA